MADITLEHAGRLIRFDERADKWNCRDLGLEEFSLFKLKTKIDDADRDARRTSVAVVILRPDFQSKPTDGRVSIVSDSGRMATVFFTPTDKRKPVRRTLGLEEMAPDTPEARAAIEKWIAALSAVEVARESADNAYKAILADIKPLVGTDDAQRPLL